MKRSVMTWLLVGLCAACGGDGDGGGSGDDETESGDANDGDSGEPVVMLTEISKAKATSLCEAMWLAPLTMGTPEQECTSEAVSFSFTKRECLDARDECLETFDEDREESVAFVRQDTKELCAGTTADTLPKGCAKYSVAEFERCVADLKAIHMDMVEQASCDELEPEPPFAGSCVGVFDDCMNQPWS